MKFLKYFAFSFLIFLAFLTSCTDEDNDINNNKVEQNLELQNNIVEDFSTIGFIESSMKGVTANSTSRDQSEEIQAIIDDLLAKDSDDPFITQMVYNFGYPSWENTLFPEYDTYGLGIVGFIKPNESTVSAVMYSAKQDDGSYLYGTYSREDILSEDYSSSISQYINLTHLHVITDTIFHDVDCEIENMLAEQLISEFGLKEKGSESSTRDCLVTVTYQDCVTYSGSTGGQSWSFTTCGEPYDEVITISGCGGITPLYGGSGWADPSSGPNPGDNGPPRPDPLEDGGDDPDDTTNNDDSSEPLSIADELCLEYPVYCDCISSAAGKGDTREIFGIINRNKNLIDPCNPNKNVMESVLSNVCFENSGELDLNSLETALSSPDYIDFTTLKDDCKCLYNYFTQLSGNQNNNNWLCGMLNELQNADQNIFFQDFELTDEDKFRTLANYSSGTATMLVPRSACEGQHSNDGFPGIDPNSLIGGQFIHEFLHSYLAYLWSKDNEGPLPDDFYIWTTNENGEPIGYPNTDYYIDLVESFVEGEVLTGDQHVLFFTHLKDLIINSLQTLNGGEGLPENYEYYFHLLVNTPNLVDQHLIFAEAMGFVDDLGNEYFDINAYLDGWQKIGGSETGAHLLFDPNCN